MPNHFVPEVITKFWILLKLDFGFGISGFVNNSGYDRLAGLVFGSGFQGGIKIGARPVV